MESPGLGGRGFQAQRAAHSSALESGRAWPLRIKRAGVAQVREGQAGVAPRRPPA